MGDPPSSCLPLWKRWVVITLLLLLVISLNVILNPGVDREGSTIQRTKRPRTRNHDAKKLPSNATITTTRDENSTGGLPRTIWLMSFPNSGTTYTLKYVQGVTNTTTGTNYGGGEQVGYRTSIPVYPDHTEGPFYRYPDRTIPEHFLLTKTHCDPQDHMTTASQFEQACRTGNRRVNGVRQDKVTYTLDGKLLAGAIHLVRNPFDNVVARLHYSQKSWNSSSDESDQKKHDLFTRDKEGFELWCSYQDHISAKRQRKHGIFDSELWKELLEPLPCHAEFYRYLHWHNMAFSVLEHYQYFSANFRIYTLFYENYTQHFTDVTNELLNFLQFEDKRAEPPDFFPGKTYPDYFEPEHVELVSRLAQAVLKPEAYALLQHYFGEASSR